MHKSRILSFFSILTIALSSLIASTLINSSSVYAYTINISTEDTITIDTPTGGGTTVHNSYVDVETNCRAGYSLTMSGASSDNTLYLSGDSSYSTDANGHISPVDGTSALNNSNNNNAWGYFVTNDSTVPTASSVFLPVSTSQGNPVIIRTPLQTASESDIDERVPVYFGTNATFLKSGTYKMSGTTPSTSGIVYYATTDPTCTASLDITFDGNTEDTVANLPTMQDVTIVDSQATLPNTKPSRSGYIFKEWNTEDDGTGDYFYAGQTVTIGDEPGQLSGMTTLYAIWVENCASGYICYDGNHADTINDVNDGTMPDQAATNGNTIALLPSNFSRVGYGFLGWNTEPDGTGTQYGPNQNFTMPSTGGVNLFAKWLAPTGTLQTWANASSMNVGDVIALKDNRDNEVYMVAKLGDNNIWITENLRLVPNTANITANNTHSPTSDFLSAYGSSSSSTMCSSDNATCDDTVKFNTNNINRGLTRTHDTNNDDSSSWYSYGVMYNWYTATAGNGLYSRSSGSVSGDICPAGWHLPTGGSGGEWGALNTAVNGGYTDRDVGLRTYPVNIIRSGDYNSSSGGGTGRGTQGRIWSTTAASTAKAYRMGYSASDASATAKSWNKWDGFAVRCIYQGGNIPFTDITVTFPQNGISSVTFVNENYPTVTATPSNPTVNIAENAAYTITATETAPYEFTSWSATNGTLGSSNTNPTTLTVGDNPTLTVAASEIPSYTVTATLGEHVNSISLTHPDYGTQIITNDSNTTSSDPNTTITQAVNSTGTFTMRRGIVYTLSSSYEEGYSIDEWTTSENGTLGSTTSAATTFSVTGTATLSVSAMEADELTYTLVYSAGDGTDAPDSETISSYHTSETFTITNSTPIYYGYTFTGWSETSGASTATYVSGDTITVASTGVATTKTLYPVYTAITSCPANKICYYENGADVNGGGRGTMANQTPDSSGSTRLIPSNYSRAGYGFAGWTTAANATPYGSSATITNPSDISTTGLVLYAKWVKSIGEMQTWNGCNAMTTGSIIALTDNRDGNTYAIAKLADDNCWTMENLRLDPGTATITADNTHNPTADFITQSGNTASVATLCNEDTTACLNQIQYNTNSTNRSLTQSHTANTNSAAWYAYGTYFNWYTATAGNGVYTITDGTSVNGDICPKRWHIPTGNTTGEYNALNTAINSGATNTDVAWRAYPNNFVYSGDYKNTNRNSSNGNGRVWTATAKTNTESYRAGIGTNTVTVNNTAYNKWDGFVVRCMRDEVAAEYSDVTVTLPQHVTSITFENSRYGNETATAQNLTVSLAQNTSYTITANTDLGYELTSWTVGSNATLGNANDNPTTLIITDDTTLTATVQEIPSYTVTVNLDAHSSSVTFTNASYGSQTVTNPYTSQDGTHTGTVTLRENVEYIITGTFDSANYYTFNSWSTTQGGTLGSATSSTTTYTVTSTVTLSLTSKLKTGATTLLPGQELNTKMKTLAEGTSTSYNTSSSKIKALRMADSLPSNFTPSSSNTVSVANSEKPVYIFYDNTNDAGIMYFYTEARDVYMNQDSSYAFNRNTTLSDISAVADWNTDNVTDMSYMFYHADALTNIDALSGWDTGNVTNMRNMFSAALALTDIDALSGWDTSNITDMRSMFIGATSLTNIDGASNWDTSNVKDMGRMFSEATSLTNIDALSNWDTSNVKDMGEMFRSVKSTNINALKNWNTSRVVNMNDMFDNDTSLTNIDGASNWDTSSVTDMNYMFRYAHALTNINGASSWDTKNVTDMHNMFYYVYALTNVDALSNWDTSSVTDMHYMFAGGTYTSMNLEDIDGMANWNTGNVTNMEGMFNWSPVVDLDALKNWDTSNVVNMRNMFRNTSINIEGSDINDWDIGNVKATAKGSTYENNNFFCMFGGGLSTNDSACTSTYSNHPEFTKRSGTWNSNGTFIPSDTTDSLTVNATIYI